MVGAESATRGESAKTKEDTGVKRSRQEEELYSIQEKINNSRSSIGFLKNRSDKGACPKTLRYNMRETLHPMTILKEKQARSEKRQNRLS